MITAGEFIGLVLYCVLLLTIQWWEPWVRAAAKRAQQWRRDNL